MDAQRFDALTKALGRGANRRRVLRGLLGGAVAGGAVVTSLPEPAAAQPGCRREGNTCQGNQVCCPGLVCVQAAGPGNAARCVGPTPSPLLPE